VIRHEQILELHAAAISAGLSTCRVALLAGIDREIVAALPGGPNDAARLLSDLDALNQISPGDGSILLKTWLQNAIRLLSKHPAAGVFERCLASLEQASAPGVVSQKVDDLGTARRPIASDEDARAFFEGMDDLGTARRPIASDEDAKAFMERGPARRQ
jgi:Effector-associated domain 5